MAVSCRLGEFLSGGCAIRSRASGLAFSLAIAEESKMSSNSVVVPRSWVLRIMAVLPALVIAAMATAQEQPAPDSQPAETTGEAQGPAPLTPEQATAAAKEGEEALQQRDFEKALQAYNVVYQWGSQNPYTEQGAFAVMIALTGRGQALVGLQEYEAALEEFKNSLDLNRAFIPALVARGNLYLELGQADQALPDFLAAAKASRGDLQAQFGLGKAMVQLGGFQQSIRPLTKVLDANPENAEAHRLRGSAYAALFKTPEGMADLEEAIRLNPEDYEAYFILGMVYLREEKFTEATDQVRKSIEHYRPKPGQEELPYLQGYLTLSSAYIEQGKAAKDEAAKKAAYQAAVDTAKDLLVQYDEKNPSLGPYRAAVLYSRGVGERMLNQLGKAVQTFSEAIELNPELGEAYFRRGICFHLLGEDKMAIADFVRAANINFTDPRANLWEGFTHAKQGDYHEALRAYGNAISASDRYIPAYVNRGLAYMNLGEYNKAVADFNEAIRLEPANAEHYFKRGVAYERLDDHEKAAASFASAIEFNDKHSSAYRHMASTMQVLGRTELANEYRQKANELAPKRNGQ
jgi:tetratricopeptide (TPR) repeat protein